MKINIKVFPRQQEFVRKIILDSAKDCNFDANLIERYYPFFPDEVGELESVFVIEIKNRADKKQVSKFITQLTKHPLIQYAEEELVKRTFDW